MRNIVVVLFVALLGCKQSPSKLDDLGGGELESKDILARKETAPEVQVKHVLLGWKDLGDAYQGHLDPRAAKRTKEQTETLARQVENRLRSNPSQVDALIKEYSEDPGSLTGEPYAIKSDTPFVPEFKNLAMRLKLDEVGVVKSNFGYHVMVRVPPPAPDALESADILARTTTEPSVAVQHVLIGWKEAPGAKDPRAKARTKPEADKIAKDILEKVRGGGDMAALMKEFSEDGGSKDNARVYDVTSDSRMVEPFKNLSLRLKMGESGLVKSPFGWHVIKRVAAAPPPPPPAPAKPDSLDSADILKREPVTKKAKVKHILLGWAEVHAEDPRGVKRDRATLEKLVKDTVAKIQKGAKIEPLMTELSEDPGSAKTGEGYDVTPEASLVQPFKDLSLRLNVKEVGVVKSDFGIHIIQRVE
ncbi:MAG: Peptidyl-prolyl cis-trans isomerase PpiD [Myxococcales bacterium]|nr:Peptidyl-prolyl cis-trans isomerase PpiD [Myxococcales bacterium]